MDFSRNSLDLCQEYSSDFSGSLDLELFQEFSGYQKLGGCCLLRVPIVKYCSVWTCWHVLERLHSVQSLWHPCCCPTFQACLEDCRLLHFAQHIWRAAVGLGLGLASDVSLSDRPCITRDCPLLPMHRTYSCWKAFSEASPHHLQVHQPLCNFLFSSWMLHWWKQGTDKASHLLRAIANQLHVPV